MSKKFHPDKRSTAISLFEPYCEQDPECVEIIYEVIDRIYTTLLGIKEEVLNGEDPVLKQSLRDISNQVLTNKTGKAMINMLNTLAKTI